MDTLGKLLEELEQDNVEYTPAQVAEIIMASEWLMELLEAARNDSYQVGYAVGYGAADSAASGGKSFGW